MTARPLKSITLKLATADEIRAMSGGEATVDATFDATGAAVPGGLFWPAIFGDDGSGFGHIELACPVVHPWYEDAVRLLTGMDDLSDGAAVLEALRTAPQPPPMGGGGAHSLPSPPRRGVGGEVGPHSSYGRCAGDELSLPSPPRRGVGGEVCLAALRMSGIAPETLVIQALPVVPPSMRLHVQAQGGPALSSDLNELYRRVISRSNALRDLLMSSGDKVPGAYVMDAKARLASAVKALIDGSGSPLQSLTDLLTDPNGVIKRNLAGKRQDYSGRSVIVSGPELKFTQCGLPYEMALEQYKPFIARRMVENGAAATSREALEKIAFQPNDEQVRAAAEQVVSEKLILLNRAPTLHRLGIQPFEPVLLDSRAIALHPLVCYAYNADFDGDQMASHVPISSSAQAEARSLLDSALNLVSPADGSPVAGPVQDIVLGLWYLTAEGRGEREEGGEETGSAASIAALVESGDLHPHTPVVLEDREFSGEDRIETTAGRVLLNARLPREVRFANAQTSRRDLSQVVALCLERCGRQRTREMLDDLNELGFEFATRYGGSYGLGVVPSSDEVERIGAEALARDHELQSELPSEEYRKRAWELWAGASGKARDVVRDELFRQGVNPLLALAESGARGSVANLGTTFGIPGLAWRESGSGGTFEAAVASSFWNGMSQLEHFARTTGARRGLIDTYVRSFAAYDLMRELIYAGQGLRIVSDDCGTRESVEVTPIEWNGRVMETVGQRIRGRVAAEDIRDASGAMIVKSGDLVSKEQAAAVDAAGVTSARIRSVLTCGQSDGVCAKCYGIDLACGELVRVGAAVGVIAAHAMADPAIQLTYRTFYPAPGPGTPMPGEAEHPGGLQQMIDLLHGHAPELSRDEMIRRSQCILRYQGVTVDDKHFELIARRMYSFTRIGDPGDTSFLAGEIVANEILDAENARVADGAEASGLPAVLGILEAAEKSSGPIGAAALGDARQAIGLAALQGATDTLSTTLERIVSGLPPR